MPEKPLQQWVLRYYRGEIPHYVCARALFSGSKHLIPNTTRLMQARVYESEARALAALSHLRRHYDILPEWRIHVARLFTDGGNLKVRDTVNENNNSYI